MMYMGNHRHAVFTPAWHTWLCMHYWRHEIKSFMVWGSTAFASKAVVALCCICVDRLWFIVLGLRIHVYMYCHCQTNIHEQHSTMFKYHFLLHFGIPPWPYSPLLGGSGRVVNSLDFCPSSLKSIGCFYFRCVLSSEWKLVTVNLWILHFQL